jgi:adenylate cyclase
MKRNWKRAAICAAIALASVVITISLGGIRFFQLLSLKAQDAHFVLRGKLPTKDIVLIEMDDKALAKFPEPTLFWQPYYAEAIQGAADAGAKVLVLDVAFGIPVGKWEPENDSTLAGAYVAASQKMPVVSGFVASDADQKDPAFAVPLNMLAATQGTAAMANLTVDPDDFVRKQVLIETPQAGAPPESLRRSMALLAAEKFLGVTATVGNGHVYLGKREIPTDNDLNMTINYAGPTDTFERISLYDFITALHAGNRAQLEKWVKGKAVLLGPDNLEDRHATPFYTAFGSTNKWRSPGVEIWANSLRTLLTGDFLQPVPEWARFAALITVAGATITVIVAFAVSQTAIWSMIVLAVALIFTHILFRAGWLLSSFDMMMSFFFALIGGVTYRRATAEKKSSFFKSAVALFVGKDVARSLDQNQEIGLTGKREMVTILFSDIRGFTAFCESKDPAIIVDLLNVYMATMCKVIVNHHGHVNKFIGDGILAVFTDSDEGAEPGGHAARAIRCATDMVNAPSQFKTGTGMHSGEVVIGNVGSSDKMEFTVLGDTVNLASRLESLNKEHKTNLLMSGATHDMAGGAIDTVYLGSVPVRGKTEPMKLYTAASLMTDDIRHVHHIEESVTA